ncbi:MAG: exodeoxyribonuclease VII large subunit, partial [Methylococcaceae bacterium]|nr:exodeoxyribonuclease VII large subunit [Methylococcaceae bacterium]
MKTRFRPYTSGPEPSDEPVFTVSRLNRVCRFILNESLGTIRIEGEISNVSAPSSGHLYFTLKDTEAQVRCAMFRPQARLLTRRPQNGDHVLLKAQVSLYEPRGDFQLIVETLEEAGDGALAMAFERLKQKLAAEGLFDAANKISIPKLPRTVGVITSPTGAAIRDILTVLRRR